MKLLGFILTDKTHTHIKKDKLHSVGIPSLFYSVYRKAQKSTQEKHNRAELERKRKKNSGKCNEGVS